MHHLVHNGPTALAVESFGKPSDPAVLLVMGATASMLGWPEDFCADLAARGLHVLRFDHRDTGRSTTAPPGPPGYSVEDMAGDLPAILDALGIGRAHLVGMSLGGYLAQMVALDHPGRVATLSLIAAEPLGWDGPPLPGIPQDFLDHFATLAALDWSDPAAVTGFLVETDRRCAGSGAPFDPQDAAGKAARVLARSASPASMFNHALLRSDRDWTGRFRAIGAPTLVIHGAEDPLLPPANGRALAAGIAGAHLLLIDGMGHELPAFARPAIIDALARHIAHEEG